MEIKLIALTRYLADDGRAESLIEHAGRVCYRSSGRGDPAAFIRARVREGHESIIEHASATFELSGISRACSHQLVRHRLASYSQESQRYVDLSQLDLVVPPAIAANPDAMQIWDRLAGQMTAAYRELLALGARREDARFLLPNAAATRIVVTMNFRELLHFFKVRIHPAAQWEIRTVAIEMLNMVAEEAPAVFGELREKLKKAHPALFA